MPVLCDRDRVGLRIWNEGEARRSECETRWLVVVGTSKELAAGGDSKIADCPLLLVVTRSHNLSLDPEPLALACETNLDQ